MTSYSFAIWITLSAGLVLLFLYAALVNLRRRHLPQIPLDEIIPLLLPANMDALWQISELLHGQHRDSAGCGAGTQKRERQQVRLAMESLQRMSHNAALLQRIGYGQISSSNPLLASQAQELIDAGVHVRLYAFMGMALLFFWRLSRMNPFFSRTTELKKLMSSSLVPAYELLRNKAETLTAFKQTHFREALLQGLL